VGDADPDGAPADVGGGDVGDADVGDADPDGAPADVGGGDVGGGDVVGDADPDGAPADVGGGDVGGGDVVGDADPDGAPARSEGQARSERVEGFHRSVVRVPFTLVVDASFERSVAIEPEDLLGLGAGDVLPLDLHVSTSELFDDDSLQELDEVAAAALARGESDVTLQVSARTAASVVGVQVPSTVHRPVRAEAGPGRRIDVRGRPRAR
jgi:hypothetical protein